MTSNLKTLAANVTSKATGAAGSAAPAWRQFPFFDVVTVKDVHDLNSTPDVFKATPEISTVISSSSGVLVADIHGSIHLLNRDFESVSSWIAHTSGRVTHMVERNDILITLGEEDSVRSPLLKIWDMQTYDKKTSIPLLLRSTKIQLSNRPHPVTTVALSANLSHLAIGLGDGTVILYRHLDQSLASSNSLTALPKIRTIHESPTEPITGLGFREPTEETPNLYLFIVTTNRVLCYQASGRGSGGTPSVVDEIGTGLGCAIMDWHAKDIVVARDEAIYVCNTEGRGDCWAYEGSKSSIHTHLNYIVIVSPPFIPTAAAASATVRNYVARSGSDETDITKVTVFDPENKFVAYSGPFKQGVREVISQWGNIYVLTTDGQLLCLQEKSTHDKLDMLYRKTYFLLALNVAKTQHLDDSSVADIHRQYGDHLYLKGDYDGAMQQFVQTIGHLQPSYVIRKFLDAQRIHNLVTYLQELHSLGLANSDHTTLLLNTYTKLKDVSRLDNFIKTESKRNADSSGELPFDLDTAIRVCRQAGYFEHAAYLAKKYERHEDYLRIQIEDAGNYKDASAYLRKLGPEAAENNLARYGRAMLHSLPEETTQLLIDLCTTTGSFTEHEEIDTTMAKQSSTSTTATTSTSVTYLSYLALNRNAQASEVSDVSPPSPSNKTIIPESGSRGNASGSSTPPLPTGSSLSGIPATASTKSTQLAQPPPPPPPPPEKLPSPRVYFAHFVDHKEQFVTFLETVAYRRYGLSVDMDEGLSIADHVLNAHTKVPGSPGQEEPEDKEDQMAIWNTLLELYLTLPGESSKVGNKNKEGELKGKAMKVLRSRLLPYDHTHALILCSTHGFTEGLVLLWEKLGMYEDVVRFWIEKAKSGDDGGDDGKASRKVVEGLLKYGVFSNEDDEDNNNNNNFNDNNNDDDEISKRKKREEIENRKGLYPLVLRFLTSTPELLGKHKEDLKRILEYVEEKEIMHPLSVVQLLSRNGVASVGLVKDWLMLRIKESREEIENDKNLIRSYRLETAEKLKQVEELENREHPKVFHVTRCAICKAQLDLPAIHFMCNHSYHQRCVQERDTECPICASEHSVIKEIKRNNERLMDQHEVFIGEVEERGFEAVANAFGRGVMNFGNVEVV